MTNRKYYTYQDCGCAIELTETEFAKEASVDDDTIYGDCAVCVDETKQHEPANPFDHISVSGLYQPGVIPNHTMQVPWSHQYTYPDPNSNIIINDTTSTPIDHNAIWTNHNHSITSSQGNLRAGDFISMDAKGKLTNVTVDQLSAMNKLNADASLGNFKADITF